MLQESLGLTENQIIGKLADCLTHLNEIGALISEKIEITDARGDPLVTSAHYRSELYIAETNVAHQVSTLLKEPMLVEHERIAAWLDKYAELTGASLSEEQVEAVRKAASNRVFILTGGPGVGKTTTANAIIRLLKAMGKSVALGAPTGRAAQRLTEVAATPARTIHRLLEWLPRLHSFAKNESNPLTAQAVIIDEASMLDIRLADALIQAIPHTAQLILIGDVDQLPSVGPGNVLRDLIDSGVVPFTRLNRIFRQAVHSSIVQAAHTINSGEDPQFGNEDRSDCQFIEVETGDDIKQVLKDLVVRRLPQEFNFDPLTDVQVLTPMNRGELGTQTLNDELQALLNPQRSSLHEYKRGNLLLRPGDKVIQSANNYDLGVFNGDIGFVQQTKVDGGCLIISFGDRIVTYEDEQAFDLRLAYAITIHKSQGSEFPAVIIPCSMQHYVMLQRNLIYTALTRARKLAIFIGSKRALQQAIRNQSSLKRQTDLIEKLKRAKNV
jgi:exodeoxyribonuclease V alpha subunit